MKSKNDSYGFAGILIIVSIALVCPFTGCTEKTSNRDKDISANKQPLVIETYKLTTEKTQKTIELSGVTEPFRQATPAARVMARVLSADFYEGENVENGRTLVTLDTRDLQTRRQQARTSLSSAQNALDVAKKNLARKRDLYRTATIPLAELEASELTESQANTAVSSMNSAINEIDVNLSYAVAKAPFNGKIVKKMTETGNMVSPGQPLFIIEDNSRLRIIAPVGTDLAASIKPGDRIAVRFGNDRTEGIIEGIVSSGDVRAPGLRVQVLIDNPKNRFKAGTLAVVELPVGMNDNKRLIVPKEALVRLGQLTGVYVAGDDKMAHLRWLAVTQNKDGSVSVLTGLNEDERIILFPAKTGVVDGRSISEAHK